MDHMGDWMLPGVALALVVIVGIVIVALDDIVLAVLRFWQSKESGPVDAATIEKINQESRRERLKRRTKHLLHRKNRSRTSTIIAPSRPRG